ncbi:hypothetical protein L861_11545 [Litchfieldella anticariensis FP35 = DSM 16096]|uniref:LysM domain-containing protein n=1 Tax=Litchfieldella anticariensis (strain DSM 16096 / CECT 5854 / CIP 108499 / LMG 22089 / FP35) TaxID=1121939 RepID=S2KGD8_LITA3|nr:peptidoglycan DD-metalloendopeptidase family protein [Halomonas anticariensis]EPC01202.1 hypothetical protein L861_11545 [Halomonas anticariensis FP35 = DSM 16096]
MRKALLISAMALSMAGCATQSEGPSQVQVRDLSMSRERAQASTYTVEAGDTLYGIAWRHDMDFRDLARLNNIGPPYRLQPGQELRLDASGSAGGGASASALAESGAQASGAQTTGAVQASGATDINTESGNLDWLSPDQEAIERNRRLTARSLDESGTSEAALGAAAAAGGQAPSQSEVTNAPGPIYNYGSPGADGRLSERDRAESEALAASRQAAEPSPEPNTGGANTQPTQPASSDTQSSSVTRDTQPQQQPQPQQQQPPQQQPDAGAAVAGESNSSTGGNDGRTYTPVEDIPWQWPADGTLLASFGEGSSITAGIDIGGQKGQPVKAAGPGIVVYAGSGVRGYGNLILLKHNDQFLSAYAHNESLRVKENDVVEAGEVIATMGDTDTDGVKLHFEVRRDGQPQNPLEYLPSR